MCIFIELDVVLSTDDIGDTNISPRTNPWTEPFNSQSQMVTGAIFQPSGHTQQTNLASDTTHQEQTGNKSFNPSCYRDETAPPFDTQIISTSFDPSSYVQANLSFGNPRHEQMTAGSFKPFKICTTAHVRHAVSRAGGRYVVQLSKLYATRTFVLWYTTSRADGEFNLHTSKLDTGIVSFNLVYRIESTAEDIVSFGSAKCDKDILEFFRRFTFSVHPPKT